LCDQRYARNKEDLDCKVTRLAFFFTLDLILSRRRIETSVFPEPVGRYAIIFFSLAISYS
jgi:hypothetical protein